MLVRISLSAYFFMQSRELNACQQWPSETKYVDSSPTIGIFMQSRQLNACQQQPSETNNVGSSPTIGIFLYVAQTVERVLAVAFGNKLCSRFKGSTTRKVGFLRLAIENNKILQKSFDDNVLKLNCLICFMSFVQIPFHEILLAMYRKANIGDATEVLLPSDSYITKVSSILSTTDRE